MKRTVVFAILVLLICTFIGISFAGEVTVFRPNQYWQAKGKLNLYVFNFPGKKNRGKHNDNYDHDHDNEYNYDNHDDMHNHSHDVELKKIKVKKKIKKCNKTYKVKVKIKNKTRTPETAQVILYKDETEIHRWTDVSLRSRQARVLSYNYDPLEDVEKNFVSWTAEAVILNDKNLDNNFSGPKRTILECKDDDPTDKCINNPITCPDDNNPCTIDQCNPQTGLCGIPIENGTSCADSDVCNGEEVCSSGICQAGTTLNCDDGNICTDDSCDSASGCVNANNTASCDDGDACTTTDICSGGTCEGGSTPNCDDGNVCTDDSCDSATGCVNTNNTVSCNDGDACTTADTCSEGTCEGGSAPDCDDGNVCTDDSCDSATGCVNTNNTASCDDGDACTTADICSAGACIGGSAPDCDDGNICTDDNCDSATGCINTNNTASCDDGDACTTTDTCSAGVCESGSAPNCDDENVCTDNSCDSATGCVNTNNTVSCDDGDACTTADTCSAGACVGGAAPDCDDGNICTDDSCDSATGCINTNNTDSCDDGDACTTADTCSEGTCEGGTAPDCDDGNVCTDDSCDSATGCVNTNNTASCDDGDACTTADTCSAGACVGGSAPNCDDGNVCTDDSCDSATGCVNTNNTASCDDGDNCTAGDICSSGQCAGTPIDCLFVTITSPSDGDTFNTTSVTVTGNIGSSVVEVTVNGAMANLSGNTFSVQIGLPQGNSTIEAVAGDGIGGEVTDTVNVFVDSIPPQITISSPSNGEHFTTDTVDVEGSVNESVSSVLVNGIPATINGNSFSASSVPLNACENSVEVVANDLLDNSSNKSITVYNDSQSPPVTEESGYLVGYVYEAGDETPIEGATVTIGGICGSVQTDVNGRYVFPVSNFPIYSPTRKFKMAVEKEGYTHINKMAEGRITKEESIEPIYLTPIDNLVTTITSAAGGVAANSAGNTEVVIPPGAAPTDIDVTITMYDSDEQLPTLLPPDKLLYAIGQFEPKGMIFNDPVTVRLPNLYNMPPGMAIPCVDYDPETGTWHDVDDGIVSDDGRFIDLEVQHFSWYGGVWIPDVVDDDPTNSAPEEDEVEDNTTSENDPEHDEKDHCNSAVSIKRGSLEVSHSTVSYRSMGGDQELTLRYDSSTARPQKVISFNISGDRTPKLTRAEFIGFGVRNKIYLTGDAGKHSLLIEAKDANGEWLENGVYAYSLDLTNYYDITRRTQVNPGEWVETTIEKQYSTSTGGQLVVNNQTTGHLGSGWQISEVSKLINDYANGPAIIDGSGETTRFESLEYWIDTVAGGGIGDGGYATQTSLRSPDGVAVDIAGNIFIAMSNRIRKVDTNGIITTMAGNGSRGFSGDGGDATQARLNHPHGVAVDSAGNLFIADHDNQRIRKVDTNGIITTVAGSGTYGYSGDGGDATQARLYNPRDVTVDSAGNLFIADHGNSRIRKVDTNGIITTVAGNGASGYSGDGGDAIQASLNYPFGVAVDFVGNLFIADSYNNRIRKVDTNGIITTVAGNGSSGFSGDGGNATQASINRPYGVAVDSVGNLFIAGRNNSRIRKVDINGIITTVAGNGSSGFSVDGGPATDASLSPNGVAVDSVGNLFITDFVSSGVLFCLPPGKKGKFKSTPLEALFGTFGKCA